MSVDRTLLSHWQDAQRARARARRRLPAAWLEDDRPGMAQVTDLSVELFARLDRPSVARLPRPRDR